MILVKVQERISGASSPSGSEHTTDSAIGLHSPPPFSLNDLSLYLYQAPEVKLSYLWKFTPGSPYPSNTVLKGPPKESSIYSSYPLTSPPSNVPVDLSACKFQVKKSDVESESNQSTVGAAI